MSLWAEIVLFRDDYAMIEICDVDFLSINSVTYCKEPYPLLTSTLSSISSLTSKCVSHCEDLKDPLCSKIMMARAMDSERLK